MAEDHTFIGKVKNSEPERFAVITIHADWSGPKHVTFLSDKDLRNNLRKMAVPEEEIESQIAHWRSHPV